MSDKPIETSAKLSEKEHLRLARTIYSFASAIDRDGSVFQGDPELTQRERVILVGELSRLGRFHNREGKSPEEHEKAMRQLEAQLDKELGESK